MTVSIVIPTSGRPESLRATLESIRVDPSLARNAEVLVVENGRPAGAEAVTTEAAATMPIETRFVLETAAGLHAARHCGIRQARQKIVAFLDDDVLVSPGWAAAIVAPFADLGVACAGGPVVPEYEGEKPAWLGQFDPWYLSALDLGAQRRELHWPEGVNGCNMAVRRQVLLAVGGFNPDAFADPAMVWLRGDGEGGLQRKLHKAGLRVAYEPGATVTHVIPRARLTADAFVRRARLEGISASFTVLRERGFGGAYRRALLVRAARALALAWRRDVGSLLSPRRAVRARADAAFWRAFAQHHVRAFASASLQAHISRADFLT